MWLVFFNVLTNCVLIILKSFVAYTHSMKALAKIQSRWWVHARDNLFNYRVNQWWIICLICLGLLKLYFLFGFQLWTRYVGCSYYHWFEPKCDLVVLCDFTFLFMSCVRLTFIFLMIFFSFQNKFTMRFIYNLLIIYLYN